jgi:hypothetical protein
MSRCSSARAPQGADRLLPKAERGQFAVAKVEPKRKVTEFRVDATR